MSVALGLIVALSFGSADFLGGRGVATSFDHLDPACESGRRGCGRPRHRQCRRRNGSRVRCGAGRSGGGRDFFGLGLLYQGLARARIGVVAPITAVMGSLVPVGWALARGERPSVVVIVGVGCAVVAGGLIARERSATEPDRPVASGVGYTRRGTALGASLVLYNETSHASGFWPLAVARLSGLFIVLICFAVLAGRARQGLLLCPGSRQVDWRPGPDCLT